MTQAPTAMWSSKGTERWMRRSEVRYSRWPDLQVVDNAFVMGWLLTLDSNQQPWLTGKRRVVYLVGSSWPWLGCNPAVAWCSGTCCSLIVHSCDAAPGLARGGGRNSAPDWPTFGPCCDSQRVRLNASGFVQTLAAVQSRGAVEWTDRHERCPKT